MKQFNYFENHGNENGSDDFTIVYGNINNDDSIIVGAEDTKKDAQEACNRLNTIIESLTRDKEELLGLFEKIQVAGQLAIHSGNEAIFGFLEHTLTLTKHIINKHSKK